MLYKFKSKATSDLIMLEPHGRKVLTLLGKDPVPKGIILPGQMAAAVATLEQAVRQEEADQKAAMEEALAQGKPLPQFEAVSLRQRTQPFIEMLKRSSAEAQEIVWGV